MPEGSLKLHETLTLVSRLEEEHRILQEKFYRLREQFETSYQTLEAITTHISEGLIFIGHDKTIPLLNLTAEKILGISRAKIFPLPYTDLFEDTFFGFSIEHALAHPTTVHRLVLTLNNNREVEVSTSSIPHKGILIVLRDRTEIKHLEQIISHNDRMKELGEMAATLAHEIRNPLGGIEGFAALLLRDLNDPNHLAMVESITRGSRALNRLVTQVLDFARPLDLHFAPVNLVTILQEAISLFSATSSSCVCHFKIEVPSFIFSADQERLLLVFLNFFRNSVEAGSPCIHIFLDANGLLSIRDEGEGIDKENLEKIFTPFFTTKSYGTGLGLAEAYKVIQAHGGTLTIQSEKGKGTEVICLLKKS